GRPAGAGRHSIRRDELSGCIPNRFVGRGSTGGRDQIGREFQPRPRQATAYLFAIDATARRAASQLFSRDDEGGNSPPRARLQISAVTLCASAPLRELESEKKMFSLEGKTALVTGASGGIGSAIAYALARQGARLALSGSNSAKL